MGLPPKLDASDEDKADYSLARFAAQNDHYIGFYKTWTKAINFLIGEQWRSKWDGTSMSWNAEKDIPPWHQQPVTNLTFAVYRAIMAKLTKQKPTLELVPPSGDSEDLEAAELGEALLTDLWRKLKQPTKLPVGLGWMLVTGMSYHRVGWDPEAGQSRPRVVPVPRMVAPLVSDVPRDTVGAAMGAPLSFGDESPSTEEDADYEDVDVAADKNGEPFTTQNPDGSESVDFDREPDMEPEGEVCWDSVSPLCVRLNPEATSHEDADEMYVGTLWPKVKAAQHFGLKEEDLDGGDESAETQALYVDMMSASAAGFPKSWSDKGTSWGVSNEEAIGSRVLVIEFYAKPCDQYRNGRHWISAGRRKVWPPTNGAKVEGQEEDQDFPHGEAPLPFGFWPPLVPMMSGIPIPGQPTHLAVLPQVVPLNEQLNVSDGHIAEHHVVMAHGGVWFASPEDKGLVITSEPGQVIYSKAMGRRGQAFAPFQAEMKALPAAVYQERDVITQKVQMVSGLSSLDVNSKPEGTPSGRALLAGQETSDSALMPTLFSIEGALEECGRRVLQVVQEKYREERTIAIKGGDGKWLYRSFTGADLRDGHDVRVQVGSMFPWNRSARWDTILSVIQALPGLVINPQTGEVNKQELAKYLDSGVPGLGAFESDQDPDLVETQREHAMFEVYDGDTERQIPQIAFWQNSPVHLKEHYEFMKRSRARFDRWHPAAQAAFMEHMQLTLAAISDQANKMLGPAVPAVTPGQVATTDGAPPSVEPAPGEAGPPGAPAPAGGPPLQLVRPQGATPPPGPSRLGRGDMAAAERV